MPKKLTVAALVVIVTAALVPLWIAPVAADEQVIAPGDMLSITVLGEPDLTKRVIVDLKGMITLPLANEVEVGGVTTTEAAGRLREKLTKYIKNPQVSMEIAEAAKRQVVVSGAVKAPGVYDIGPDARLMAALTLAGGQTPEADVSKITVTRGIKKDLILNVNLNDFLNDGKPEANIALQPGDTIIVPQINPTSGNVYVLGEVNLRGAYPLRQGMTLREVIAAAGGVTDLADSEKVNVKHQNDATGTTFNYAKVMGGDPTADVALQPGDTVFVPAVETHGTFTILGPVARPGQYPVRGDMTITDAIAAAGGMTVLGNMSKVRVMRVGDKPETLDVDVNKVIAGQSTNVAVQSGDTISVGERKPPTDKLRAGGLLASILFFVFR